MLQTDLFNDKSFQCEMHPEQSMKLICFSEKCTYKRRFICLTCLLEEKKEMDNIATLQDFIRDPISFLDKANEYQQLKRNHCDPLLKQIEEFEIILQKGQSDILLQLNKLKVQVLSMAKNHQQIQNELLKRLKIHEFQQQLTLVWKMDSYQGTKEFALLEQNLNNIVLSWKECCDQTAKQMVNEQSKLSSDIQVNMDDKLKQEKYLYDNLVKSLTGLFYQETGIPLFVQKEISQGKQIKWDLLYKGTRDGLTCANYWQRCDQQSHLLIIITLKNCNRFGGYCPCQLILKYTGGYYVVGTGHDFCVQSDFKKVSSNLGHSYDITGYNVKNQTTHLIGDKDTEITECEVYKISFI